MSETLALKKTSNPTTGSATVSIASKLPWGLLLQLYDFREESEHVHGSYRKYTKAYLRPGSPTFTIAGNAYRRTMGDNGKNIDHGFAITAGIPKTFWEEWYEQNKQADYIVNGLIFAHGDLASLHSEAAEKSKVKSGLERMDPNNLPILNGRKIETAKIHGD